MRESWTSKVPLKRSVGLRPAQLLVALGWILVVANPLRSQSTLLHDSFVTLGNTLNRARWTTEIGAGSYLGRTQLADWVTPGGVGRFVVARDGAQLALHTFNPTGLSLYGTHAKTLDTFQPAAGETIVLKARIRLTSLQRGLVYGIYFYGCPSTGNCAIRHDEIDIELVTNLLQPGAPRMVQLNRYADEPLGAGNGSQIRLPDSFDPLAWHEWEIRWSRERVEYLVDGTPLMSTVTHVPQGPMQANLIAWAPSPDWQDAYHAGLQPTASAQQDQQFTALVSSVDVASARLPGVASNAVASSLSIVESR